MIQIKYRNKGTFCPWSSIALISTFSAPPSPPKNLPFSNNKPKTSKNGRGIASGERGIALWGRGNASNGRGNASKHYENALMPYKNALMPYETTLMRGGNASDGRGIASTLSERAARALGYVVRLSGEWPQRKVTADGRRGKNRKCSDRKISGTDGIALDYGVKPQRYVI